MAYSDSYQHFVKEAGRMGLTLHYVHFGQNVTANATGTIVVRRVFVLQIDLEVNNG
jgi:hypothetical protein